MSFLASNSIFLVVPVRALSVSIPTIDGFVGWIKIIPLDYEPAETPGALPQIGNMNAVTGQQSLTHTTGWTVNPPYTVGASVPSSGGRRG